MSTFQQTCPGCGRELELPADTKGRLGKCPACEATFTIGAVAKGGDLPVLESARTPPNLPNATGESNSHPESASEPAAGNDAVAASAHDVAPPRPRGQTGSSPSPIVLQVRDCEIEDVLSTTLSIFFARWRTSIAPVLMAMAAGLLVVVVPLLILVAINKTGAQVLAGLGLVIWSPIACACTVFLLLGLVRAELAVTRNETLSWAEMTAPAAMLLRAIGVLLMLIAVVSIVGVVGFSFVAIVRAAGATLLARILVPLAIGITLMLLFGLTWQFWSWIFVFADRKGDAMGSLRAAGAISSQNKLTSFFLVMIALVLALVGVLTCGVGYIVTAPLTLLLFAVAYLLMTGQIVDDPQDVKP